LIDGGGATGPPLLLLLLLLLLLRRRRSPLPASLLSGRAPAGRLGGGGCRPP